MSKFESALFPIDRLAARKRCLHDVWESTNGDVAVAAVQQAVREVIDPEMSSTRQKIVKESKTKRKSVPIKQGEILTSPVSLKRLEGDEKRKLEKGKSKARNSVSLNQVDFG